MAILLNPKQITKFNQSEVELQTTILWWIAAAGKNGITAATAIHSLLSKWEHVHYLPFNVVRYLRHERILADEMKAAGMGCYYLKSDTYVRLVRANLNLSECTLDDLLAIKGIGPKTARCFLLHSRENQRYAGLDRHVLSYMADLGFKVPKNTPNAKQYTNIENHFLRLVDERKFSVPEFDLLIWNHYAGNADNSRILFC